ncbi:LutC/YkgG family protein [Adhaeribacter terreus]|uniref:Lactate utilization protein C n=1 Tax=Adhaeribacter terreus TaxID=529703 RepID=A0ABW0E7W6_9BACT
MYEARSKDIVLRKVREALAKSAPFVPPTPDFNSTVYPPLADEDLSIVFAQNFLNTGGKFIYCDSEENFYDQLFEFKQENNIQHIFVWESSLKKQLFGAGINFSGDEKDFLKHAEAGLTTCEALLARTGSILVSSANSGGRRLTIYPEKHLVVAYTSQLVPDIKEGLQLVREKYAPKLPSMLSMVSGPSRTADIEKTLVLGAHGPKQLVLFLIDDLIED